MYYVIETNYVGPNADQDQYVDADKIEISTTPATTNSSHEERIEGWCGTTNDWAVFAHGEYPTIEAARQAIEDNFGVVRDADANGPFESMDENVVEVVKPGRYAPMSPQATADWCYEDIQAITADTSDSDIAELIAEIEANANSEGCTVDSSALERFMEERRRQELRDDDEI